MNGERKRKFVQLLKFLKVIDFYAASIIIMMLLSES